MATVSFESLGAAQVELPIRPFDADDYMAMVGAGVFEEKRVELIEGYVIDMSPAHADHNYIIMRLNELFIPIMGQFKLWVQGTLHVNKRNVFDPDFMLLNQRELSYKKSLPTPHDVALLVEVAGTSRQRDFRVKKPIYAAQGICDYWIADVERETLTIHRQPSVDSYGEVHEFSREAVVAPLAAPHFALAVSSIFD